MKLLSYLLIPLVQFFKIHFDMEDGHIDCCMDENLIYDEYGNPTE